MKKTSIKDIAKLSGVSVATVSRVINNNGRFSEETRKKILDVIEETGYQMNFSAKSLRMNKSFSVGILVPDISNYFFSDMVQKIEEELFELGYSTIICNTGRNIEKETAYLNMLRSKLVDGIIVISGVDEFVFHYDDIPYICIDREPLKKEKTIFISSNHYQGAFEATESLINNGCKHPAILMYDRQSSSAKERFKGYKDALKKNNISYNESSHLLLSGLEENFTENLQAFLERTDQVDSFFAVNDTLAMKLFSSLKELGEKIPEDFKIIGFDDSPLAHYSSPTLSSVKQNTDKIAQFTVKNLIDFISSGKIINYQTILVPVELVVRNSSLNN
ncbi:LacI family DNA-binding transcriptional regulator [Lactococcus cremoris]|uniref:Transcriptional regulator, LacI family n=2 Tax=Lactococcus lactis subsp. cremoris TaxID=1359 RepID=Q02Y35_LACLS|nr:LacI family DNA-binding transcriptional regulator [Lactococcus cremoris]ABJ73137.1 transcriptional regulator, LacI family [Lactococcus cremoris subsp. cremoris SK11]ARE23748.1 LacI family DNA-binding transcriptional regulator [Lactococcus cremoris]KZK45569.1 Transcriptional regulator of D-allose utilization LacI family [Lactococcus cremoris]KZK52734.1 Transcriptional regulator of D-allose utilization LacI family [Lactococcus cremoris]MCT4408395.1 LacI family transcriptional regulator [Lacto